MAQRAEVEPVRAGVVQGAGSDRAGEPSGVSDDGDDRAAGEADHDDEPERQGERVRLLRKDHLARLPAHPGIQRRVITE